MLSKLKSEKKNKKPINISLKRCLMQIYKIHGEDSVKYFEGKSKHRKEKWNKFQKKIQFHNKSTGVKEIKKKSKIK
jgi:hypothetical protein